MTSIQQLLKKRNMCPTNYPLITAEPALDEVMCAYPHSTTEVFPTTPDMPVCEHHPASETAQPVATALHAMHPATAIHTSQDRDAQLGGQYGAWSSGGGVGSGLSEPLARGMSGESVSTRTTPVHCTYKYDVPRDPPTLLPDYISPLPGYGQSGVCGTGVGSVYQGFLQPFSH
jgi:hypothetical protein